MQNIEEEIIMAKKLLSKIAMWLVLIGALNWGLIGALNFNLVTTLLGTGTLTAIVYVLVGLSAIYSAIQLLK